MSSSFQERLANERRRLIEGPSPDEKPGGMGTVRFIAWCPGNTEQVVEKAKSVLLVVNENSAGEWPSEDRWRELLPGWFVARCAPELTQQEAEAKLARWRRLSPEEQTREEEAEKWSLLNWISWFKPDERYWYWWDARPVDENVLAVAVEVYEWPFPWGTLSWLLRAAGADRVEAEE